MPIDYGKYPSNWKSKIRPKVLTRANNCCEFCGVENHRLIHRFGKGKDDSFKFKTNKTELFATWIAVAKAIEEATRFAEINLNADNIFVPNKNNTQ